jgi:hypothetical protein
VRWDIDGFPLVDAGQTGVECSSHVTGFAISTLPRRSSPRGEEDSDAEEGTASAREEADAAHREHRALLVQQTARGDAFVQRVMWGRNPYTPAARAAKLAARQSNASNTSGGVGAASLSASQQAHRRQQKRKRKSVYLRGSEDEEEDEESESESSDRELPPLSKAIHSAGSGVNSVAAARKRVEENPPQDPPPVQLCLPCGARITPLSVSTEKSTSTVAWRAIKNYLQTRLRNNGLILLNALSSQCDASNINDTDVSYPSGSRAFPPFVPEDSLRGFDLLKMNPGDVRSGARVGGTVRVKAEVSAERVATAALSRLEEHGACTLWELWRQVSNALDNAQRPVVSITDLRTMLSDEHTLLETIIPTQPVGAPNAAPAIQHKPGGSENHADDLSETQASDAESQDFQIPRGSSRRASWPVPVKSEQAVPATVSSAGTFDGLYVLPPPAEGRALTYTRDQTLGYEVRMSRLMPPGGAQASVEADDAERCTCDRMPHRGGVGPQLELCDSPHCVNAHRLVYRIARSSQPNTTSSAARLKTGTAEPFYLLGQPMAPAAHESTSVSTSLQSPAAALRTRLQQVPQTASRAVPAISQQSVSLSQLMFGTQTQSPSQTQAPVTQSQHASSQTILGKSATQPPGTAKKRQAAALTEPPPGLEVTDNMLAVLNNNWNRAVGNTPHVDPAASSLLHLWR